MRRLVAWRARQAHRSRLYAQTLQWLQVDRRLNVLEPPYSGDLS